MLVGLCEAELRLAASHSLKDKRRVLKGLIQQLHNRFNVSVAEVEAQDQWQRAVIGIACVSNETAHLHQVMAALVRFLEQSGEAVLVQVRTEVL